MVECEQNNLIDIDHFPCGCLITTRDLQILFANKYFQEALAWDPQHLISTSMLRLLTRSSQIFCESYILPSVYEAGSCSEVQLAILDARGHSVAKIASVRMMPNGNFSWVFLEAEKRNKLFHQLETARSALEEQREELELLSRTDPLTGLANRRALELAAQDMFEDAKNLGQSVSVLAIDIDMFKAINDNHGHERGDKVLQKVADALKSECRANDTIARLGGDEFLCILHDQDLSKAKDVAKRIHHKIYDLICIKGLCTVCIGIAVHTPDEPLDYAEVIKRADQALYEAKNTGRNRTCISTDGGLSCSELHSL